MKLLIEKLPDLKALYIKELRLLLSAEEVNAIKTPIMIAVAADNEFKRALDGHLLETETHASRLREILHRITGEADPLKCKVVYSLFDEIEDLAQDAAHAPVRDAALLAEARRVEHYEIAAYGAVLRFARALGYEADAALLDQTTREEVVADETLSRIAERVYPAACKAA
jgi:ferritin-like metal-binding protein YciE